MIVANTLEGMAEWAIIKTRSGDFVRAPRRVLAQKVLYEVELISKSKSFPAVFRDIANPLLVGGVR
jgi:hypothetical protein